MGQKDVWKHGTLMRTKETIMEHNYTTFYWTKWDYDSTNKDYGVA